MRENPILLADLSFDNQFIRGWEFTGCDDWRLYFRKEDCHETCDKDCKGGHGFRFAAVEWISGSSNNDLWNNETEVEFLFNGYAFFDGVRHMYLGTQQNEIFGYVNYPRIEDLIDILIEIRKLEKFYCYDYFGKK